MKIKILKINMKDYFLYQRFSLFNIDLKLEVKRKRKVNSFDTFNYHQIGKILDDKYNNSGNFTNINFFEQQIIWLKKTIKL